MSFLRRSARNLVKSPKPAKLIPLRTSLSATSRTTKTTVQARARSEPILVNPFLEGSTEKEEMEQAKRERDYHGSKVMNTLKEVFKRFTKNTSERQWLKLGDRLEEE